MSPNRDRLPSAVDDGVELVALRLLARSFPNIPAAAAEISYLKSLLARPRGTLHVLSDIHGDSKKLRHVINNASGTLRPTVERLFKAKLTPQEMRDLLTMIYYPRESFRKIRGAGDGSRAAARFRRAVRLEFAVMREVAKSNSIRRIERSFPAVYADLFREFFFDREGEESPRHLDILLDTLLAAGQAEDFLRHVAGAIRTLSISELIVAGDCGDRGPRLDRVIDTIMAQPHVSVTWGNHDVTWMGASLGHALLIATVLRISLRYRRLSQLEEGYGIIVSPLEKLARTCYGDDAAERFIPKGQGLRETITMARMQKAIAIIEFKLEGQAIRRNPHFQMEHRNLLGDLDLKTGTLRYAGVDHALLDTHFPTIDPADPWALSPDEHVCMERIRRSFLASTRLARQMQYLNKRGTLHLVRDDSLIFHGCLAVDEQGEYLPMEIDGKSYVGKALMDKLTSVVHRCFREPSREGDLDLLWYLWAGANSPLFGKDRMATFERYLLADKATHTETKNPYFKFIHEPEFCDKVLREFGVDTTRGIIVNGHVPVKISEGENPIKRSGKAITIDGAFSEAYGDHGYTLILDSTGISLARHSHFDSVKEAVAKGTDIIPIVTRVREFEHPRLVADSEEGLEIEDRIRLLERLIVAFRENHVTESDSPGNPLNRAFPGVIF